MMMASHKLFDAARLVIGTIQLNGIIVFDVFDREQQRVVSLHVPLL